MVVRYLKFRQNSYVIDCSKIGELMIYYHEFVGYDAAELSHTIDIFQ